MPRLSTYMERKAFVVPRKNLVERGLIPEILENHFSYTRISSLGELKKLLRASKSSGEYRERFGQNGVETDPSLQQLVMYGFVVKDGRFLLYQRAQQGYSEGRLAGKVSMGIGGHMEPTDLSLGKSFYRELNEEAQIFVNGEPLNFKTKDGKLDVPLMKRYVRISLVGLIKDERDEVGKVHFGVVCKIIPKAQDVEVRIKTGESEENTTWQYVTPQEYQEMVKGGQVIPEGWTDIVFRKEILRASN